MHARIAQLLGRFESGYAFPRRSMAVRWSRTQSTVTRPTIAVILHAHYPDVALELLSRINQMGVGFDLYVTTSRDDVSVAINPDIPSNAGAVTVFAVDNIGRDVLPFVRCLQDIDLSAYSAVLKLHTKKTVGQTYGDMWREDIINQLVPSREAAGAFLAQVDRDGWGIMGPSRFLLTDSQRFWGANRSRTNSLRQKFAYSANRNDLEFFAGTMFWFKPAALKALPEIVQHETWERERGQLDGTLAHAVERIINDVVRSQGLLVRSSDVPYRDLPDAGTASNSYPGSR